MKKRSVDMTQGNIVKHIIFFAIPLMLTGVLQMLYNAADMIVVGKFSGENALAAVGSTTSPINLLVNVFIGLSSASGVILSRKFGAKDYKGVENTVHTSILVSIVCGSALMIIGVIAAKPILAAMDSPKEIISLSTLYMRIYFLGIPAMLVYNFSAAILRSIGDTKRPMYILTASGIINVILNVVFVVGFKMDVAGVALATVISQLFAAFAVLKILLNTDECYKLEWKKLHINPRIFKEILYLGIPAGIQSAAFSISNITIQSSVNSVGASAMAANAASQNIDNFTYVAMNSFHHASLTFTSQNYGAFNFKRMKRGFFSALLTVLAVGICVGSVMCIFSETLLSFFTDSASTIAMAQQRVYRISGLYFLCGMMEVGTAGLRALGMSIFPTIVTITGVCGLRVLFVYMGAPYNVFEDLLILYDSYAVTWILVTVINVITFMIMKHKKEKEHLYHISQQKTA